MERSARLAHWMVIAASAIALLASGASAAADATAKCDAAKTKLSGKMAECFQKMEARRILTGRVKMICDPFGFLERWEAIEKRARGACSNERRDFAVALGTIMEWSHDLSLAIQPPKRIVLYDAGPKPDGGFLNGSSCEAALDESFSCAAVAPFASLELEPLLLANGELGASRVPIVSRSGVTIAESWDDLFDGDFDACLQTTPGPDCTVAAGVLPDDTLFWHGSSFDGWGEASDNCNDFIVDRTGLFVGNVGLASADGQDGHASPWDGLVAECDGSNLPAPAHLVCACAQR